MPDAIISNNGNALSVEKFKSNKQPQNHPDDNEGDFSLAKNHSVTITENKEVDNMTIKEQLYEKFELEVKEDIESLRRLASALSDNAILEKSHRINFKKEALVALEGEGFIDDETAQMLLDNDVRLDEFYYYWSDSNVADIGEQIADSIKDKVSEIKSEIQEFLNKENLNQESLNQESLNQEGGQDNPRENMQGYKIIRAEAFTNDGNHGYALGYNPNETKPYITCRFETEENGDRHYYWGQPVDSFEEAEQSFNEKLQYDRKVSAEHGRWDFDNKDIASSKTAMTIRVTDNHNFFVMDTTWSDEKNEWLGNNILAGPFGWLSQAEDFIGSNNGILTWDERMEKLFQETRGEVDDDKLYRAEFSVPDDDYMPMEVFSAKNDDEARAETDKLLAQMQNKYNAEGKDGDSVWLEGLQEMNEHYDVVREVDLNPAENSNEDYSQTAANNATFIEYLRNEKGIDGGLLARLSDEGKIEHLYGDNPKPLVLKGDGASNVVLVFDKNLDLLSLDTLSKDKANLESAFEKDHKIALRASQDTPFFEPLKKFLEDNPNIDGIIPCFAEKVGFDGVMNTLKSEFGNDYTIDNNVSPKGGSWNEALMEYHEANQPTDEQEEGFDMDYDDD